MDVKTDINARLRQAGKTFDELQNYIKKHFGDMEVDFKDWYIGFGKTEEGHTVDIRMKLNIKKKAPK